MIDWISVDDRMPGERRLVMVTGESGYIKFSNFLTLAYYDEKFRPSKGGATRWLDLADDALLDHGWMPTHWAEVINFPVRIK